MIGHTEQQKLTSGQAAVPEARPPWARLVRGLMVVVALLFLGSASINPAPAFAASGCLTDGECVAEGGSIAARIWGVGETLAQWVKKNEVLMSMINWVTTIIKIFKDGIDLLRDTWGSSAQMQLAAQKVKTFSLFQGIQSTIDNNVRDVVMANDMEQVATHTLPPASEQFLCNLIVARQIIPVMQAFARIISSAVRRGIDDFGRCPTCDSNGPQYIADVKDIVAGRHGENYPPTGSKELHGVPEDMAAEPTGPGLGYQAAGIDMIGLDKVLDLPPYKDVEVKIDGEKQTRRIFIPEKDNQGQRQWIAARDFCYNFAGPRPTPPREEDLRRPSGKTKYQQYKTCLARQSDFVRVCTDRLARITRPNCDGENFKEFCAAAQDACAAANEAQISLGPEYKDCTRGLSLQQAEVLSNELCGASRRTQADLIAGANHANATNSLLLCDIMKEMWRKQQVENEDKLTEAFLSVYNTKDCFSGTGR